MLVRTRRHAVYTVVKEGKMKEKEAGIHVTCTS